MDFAYIPSTENVADVLTKPLLSGPHHKLVKEYLFRQPKTVTQGQPKLKEEPRKVTMATRIPEEYEMDYREREQRISDYLFMFRRTMRPNVYCIINGVQKRMPRNLYHNRHRLTLM